MMAVLVVALTLVACSWGAAAEPVVTNVFEDEDIRNVLHYISAQTGYNILTEPSVQGRVSLLLKEVPLHSALDMITEPLGYAWVTRDGYYMVGLPGAKNPAYASFVTTEVVKLGYLKADAAVKLLADSFAPNVKANAAANSVVITGTAAIVERIRQMLISIDTVPSGIAVDAMVVQLAAGADKLLGLVSGGGSWSVGSTSSDLLSRAISSGAAAVRTAARLLTVDGEAGEVGMTWDSGTSTTAVSFVVTPRLSREGNIIMKVAADVTESARVAGASPATNRHRASTTVVVGDGDTVLVGRFMLDGDGAGPDVDTLLILVPRTLQEAG